MKKGFKICPYCASKIKAGAKKCQFCKEFLDQDIKNGINDVNPNSYALHKEEISWFKNIRVWVFLGIVLLGLIFNIIHKINKSNANKTISSFYDSIIENNGNIDYDLDSFNEYINASKTVYDGKEAQDLFNQLSIIGNNYYVKLDSIGDLYIEENRGLKDISLISAVISNWKSYKSASDQYLQDCVDLSKNIETILGDSKSDGNMSLKVAIQQIGKLVSSIDEWADFNIDLYSYILSIQNDFYVDYDDTIIFYDDTSSMDKFNYLWERWDYEGDKFDKAYEDYFNYMSEYAKNTKK